MKNQQVQYTRIKHLPETNEWLVIGKNQGGQVVATYFAGDYDDAVKTALAMKVR